MPALFDVRHLLTQLTPGSRRWTLHTTSLSTMPNQHGTTLDQQYPAPKPSNQGPPSETPSPLSRSSLQLLRLAFKQIIFPLSGVIRRFLIIKSVFSINGLLKFVSVERSAKPITAYPPPVIRRGERAVKLVSHRGVRWPPESILVPLNRSPLF